MLPDRSVYSKMLTNLVLFVVILAAFTPAVGRLCHISECPAGSDCTWFDLDKIEYYTPLKLNAPKIDAPGHLFNLLYNPGQEKNCTNLRLRTTIHKQEIQLNLAVECRAEIITLHFLVDLLPPSDVPLIACIKANSLMVNRRKRCGYFDHNLRLNFLSDQLLLLEDLSAKVPRGASLLLEKTATPYSNISCRCQQIYAFAAANDECVDEADAEVVAVVERQSSDHVLPMFA